MTATKYGLKLVATAGNQFVKTNSYLLERIGPIHLEIRRKITKASVWLPPYWGDSGAEGR